MDLKPLPVIGIISHASRACQELNKQLTQDGRRGPQAPANGAPVKMIKNWLPGSSLSITTTIISIPRLNSYSHLPFQIISSPSFPVSILTCNHENNCPPFQIKSHPCTGRIPMPTVWKIFPINQQGYSDNDRGAQCHAYCLKHVYTGYRTNILPFPPSKFILYFTF